MKERTSIDHFESAFDSFWGAQTLLVEWQTEIVVASMTVGIEFWSPWHASRGQRAIQAIEESAYGDHVVIQAKFR